MKKINLCLLVGGRSAEHEVSLISGSNVMKVADKKKYRLTLVGIDKLGRWFLIKNSDPFLASRPPKKIVFEENASAAFVPGSQGRLIGIKDRSISKKIDVVFPVLHGTFGEDGTVQGLLELADVPYVAPDVVGSALGMDKDAQKRLLKEAEIPTAKFLIFRKKDFKKIKYAAISKKLGDTVFVKPANLGSSVGISKAGSKRDFGKALKEAFRYDNKILIEKAIAGRELECSVLGNENPQASAVGEIIPHHEFYYYKAKYIDKDGAGLAIPAKIPKKIADKFRALAVKTFRALCCEGMGRVDGFWGKNGQLYISEINTIPGFTSISMYPKLWEESGLPYSQLIDKLIELGIARWKRNNKLKRDFD